MKSCIEGIICRKPTNPNQQTQQNIPKPYTNNIFFKKKIKKINTQSKKSRVGNMKYFEKNREPIPFLEDG